LELMLGFSGAEVRATCTEAGYYAIRENRTKVKESDLVKAIRKVKEDDEEEKKDYMNIFG
jgi:ATP-dependent 26S proteasome regulatory subunit